jgi:hypothetical protein
MIAEQQVHCQSLAIKTELRVTLWDRDVEGYLDGKPL